MSGAARRADPRDVAACRALARAHYENFAIGSWLFPRRSRDALVAIYAVLRIADDIADEGRVADPAGALDALLAGLERAAAGEWTDHFALRACGAALREHGIPLDPFRALFRAFRTDTVRSRWESFDALLGYCADSAAPVGRLVLALFGEHDPSLHPASDALCTGLQLVNHWQDVAADAARGRIYLPLEDLRRFGVSEEDVLAGRENDALRALVAFETDRARSFLARGAELVAATRGRLRFEVALFRRGGLAAADAIARVRHSVMAGPPRVHGALRVAALAGALADTLFAPRRRPIAGTVSA